MLALHDFQPIAPGVAQKHAGHARFLIGGVGHTPLPARHKIRRHANMELLAVGQQEPRAAILLQRGRLLQFAQARQVTKKLPGAPSYGFEK